jgi:hypothetical protein
MLGFAHAKMAHLSKTGEVLKYASDAASAATPMLVTLSVPPSVNVPVTLVASLL